MANDCLITKLKGTVNNNNLPFFGEIRFKIDKAGSADATLTISCEEQCVIRTIEGSFKDGTTDYTLPANTLKTFYFTDEAIVAIAPSYKLLYFNSSSTSAITLNTNIFKNVTKLTNFGATDAGDGLVTGKISDFNLSAESIQELHIGCVNNIRNFIIDSMPTFSNLKIIEISNTSGSKVSTSTLAEKCPSLSTIKLLLMSGDVANLSFMQNNVSTTNKGDIYSVSSSNSVTGTVESIVGNDTTTYNKWSRIGLPNTVTITSATKTALQNAGCTVSGVSVVD